MKHYGNASDTTDYETEGHMFFVSMEFYPVDRVNLHLSGNYTMAKGSFDSVHMKLPAEVLPDGDYDYSRIDSYSDLDQSYYELEAGGNFAVTDGMGLFANVKYMDYTDDQPYVYGDYSGDWFDVTVGATVSL